LSFVSKKIEHSFHYNGKLLKTAILDNKSWDFRPFFHNFTYNINNDSH